VLREMLAGGDRRMLAQSRFVHQLVLDNPGLVGELAALVEDDDWLVGMRALDVLEKLAHEHRDWVQPHKRVFLGPVADSDKWEVRLQIVRVLPLLTWTPRERKRVVEILTRDIEHPQTFVRAWALDSLATIAKGDPELVLVVERGLVLAERSGRKALEARARHIRKRLERR
jgi:hypothetical protein